MKGYGCAGGSLALLGFVNAGVWVLVGGSRLCEPKVIGLGRHVAFTLSAGGARSPCVEQEVGRWLATKGPDSILIPLVEGMLSWSSAEGGFDPTASTAIVPALVTPRDRVNDMAWASDGTHLAATGGSIPRPSRCSKLRPSETSARGSSPCSVPGGWRTPSAGHVRPARPMACRTWRQSRRR